MPDFLTGMLTACESNMDSPNLGSMKTWSGLDALHLFREIRAVHGRLWTSNTSKLNLEAAEKLSGKKPRDLLWDSHFIRELVLSAMGGLDTGVYHTRSNRN